MFHRSSYFSGATISQGLISICDRIVVALRGIEGVGRFSHLPYGTQRFPDSLEIIRKPRHFPVPHRWILGFSIHLLEHLFTNPYGPGR